MLRERAVVSCGRLSSLGTGPGRAQNSEVDLGSAQTTEHDMFPRASALGLLEAPSNETTKVASARVANVALAAVRDAGRATRSAVKPRPKVDTVEKVEEEFKGGESNSP